MSSMWFFLVLSFHLVFANLTLNKSSYVSQDDIYKKESESDCEKQTLEIFNGIKNFELWALSIIDATGKIPIGILKGNTFEFGDYDECLSIEHYSKNGPIRGKYCPMTVAIESIKNIPISLPNVSKTLQLTVGACLPELCSTTDVQSIIDKLLLPLGVKLRTYFDEHNCYSQTKMPQITVGDIAAFIIFAVLIFLALASTLYDIFLYYTSRRNRNTLFLALSFVTNFQKLILVEKKEENITCIAGLRVISMMWVIFGHIFLYYSMTMPRNFVDFATFLLAGSKNMFIIGAPLAVDTFFVIGGAVLVLSVFNARDKKIYFNIPIYYLHRLLRLFPSVLLMVIIHATFLKHLGSGPYWNSIKITLCDTCYSHWWMTLLFIQNYVKSLEPCIPQSWYIAVDMQLTILSPLLIIPLLKWTKKTLIAIGGLVVVEIVINMIVVYVNKIGIFVVGTREQNNNLMQNYYYVTHTRALAWLVGLILGYYLYEYKVHRKRVNLKFEVILSLWALSLGIMSACLFTGHNLLTEEYDIWGNMFYGGFDKFGWSLGLSWLIYACVVGYGGPINWFLSLPVFQVLSRFTYSIYITHYAIIGIIIAYRKEAVTYRLFNWLFDFWGFYILILIISVLWTLLIESPVINLEKILLKSDKNKQNCNDQNGIKNETFEQEDGPKV